MVYTLCYAGLIYMCKFSLFNNNYNITCFYACALRNHICKNLQQRQSDRKLDMIKSQLEVYKLRMIH